ncbi:MAG TPA: class I SAM-dependent methyltransferase [Dehalococcoidia bacterium]|nr:class I SAM-dependent methyltransferase [Dehalococcoidia bacterium]
MNILSKVSESRHILYILQRLDSYPSLKKRVFSLIYEIWQFYLKISGYAISKVIDLDKTYWVNPNRIIYSTRRAFNIFLHKGKVIGGNWDLAKNRKAFEDSDVYQAFCQRFLNQKSWQETEFYHRVVAEISSGKIKWGCKCREEFDDRCKKLDELYQSVRDNGYETQGELGSRYRDLFKEDEVTVSIARTGELLFTNGRHRLSIAKLLGIEAIPVKVTVRHQKWVKFRKQILAYAESQPVRKIYDPLPYPDLADIPSFYGEDRFNIIKQNLSARTGAVLDIGSHWGYFCHKLEDEGFDCYAVENNPIHIYFLNKLREAENKKFKVIYGSIFDYQERTDFDVVLALNIFHHFLKFKTSYLKLIELLKRLEMRELFFQAEISDSSQMKNAYKNYSPSDFTAFILEHSCLREAQYIGESQDRRPIYKLYR